MTSSAGRNCLEGGRRTRGLQPPAAAAGAPLVSVVTVVLNGAEHLEQAITSVLEQEYPNTEYVVVDGGSGDRTLDILRKYSDRIEYWVSEPDRGIYDAMNKGLRLANGELVGLLNADDFYEPGALEKVVACYLEKGVPAIYYGDNLVLQEDLGLSYLHRANLRCWLGMSIYHQAMFVHRDVYSRLNGYSTAYRFAGDYDFLLRAFERGLPFLPVGGCLVNYRNTGLTSRNYRASLAEAKRINRRCFGAFSRRHAAYLVRYYKALAVHGLESLMLRLLDRRTANRLKSIYMRRVLVRGSVVEH
jgi:glycosyltransferase involved in cell wall biosynthesis